MSTLKNFLPLVVWLWLIVAIVITIVYASLRKLQGKPVVPQSYILLAGISGLVLQQFSGKFNGFSLLLILLASAPFLMPPLAKWIENNVDSIKIGSDGCLIDLVGEALNSEVNDNEKVKKLKEVMKYYQKPNLFLQDYVKGKVGIGGQ
jgi:hypothetical protein